MENKVKSLVESLGINNEEKTNLHKNYEIQNKTGGKKNLNEWRKHFDTLIETNNKGQEDENTDNLLKIVGNNSNHTRYHPR